MATYQRSLNDALFVSTDRPAPRRPQLGSLAFRTGSLANRSTYSYLITARIETASIYTYAVTRTDLCTNGGALVDGIDIIYHDSRSRVNMYYQDVEMRVRWSMDRERVTRLLQTHIIGIPRRRGTLVVDC